MTIRKKRTLRARKPSTNEMLALICKALSERFPQDKAKPGVQVAWLGEARAVSPDQPPHTKSSGFYVAVHRYPNTCTVRDVAFKTTDPDLDECLRQVAEWLVPKVDAMRNLENAIK